MILIYIFRAVVYFTQ